ncbi:MAG TPA: hypothetical protein VGQ81_14525 [Acidobacteriota bacterium]|jgi:hypothetical protein|nr:hypothetical protein [Acidobacteriota bacterium]
MVRRCWFGFPILYLKAALVSASDRLQSFSKSAIRNRQSAIRKIRNPQSAIRNLKNPQSEIRN